MDNPTARSGSHWRSLQARFRRVPLFGPALLIPLGALLLWLAPHSAGQANRHSAFTRPLQGTITVTVSGQASMKEEGDDQPITQRISRTAKHTVEINPTEAFEGNQQNIATFRGSERSFYASVTDNTSGDGERRGDAGGQCPGMGDAVLGQVICAEGAVTLILMPAQRTYGLTFNPIAVPTPDETIRIPGMRLGPIALPPDGETRLTGSQTFDLPADGPATTEKQRRDDSKMRDGVYAWVPLKIVVTWTLEPPELLEVTVESEGYRDWIPEGNIDDPSKAGNTITFKATVRERGKPAQRSDKKARITFHLENVSMEKGVCLNWPKTGASSDYDLQIGKDKNPALEISGPDEAKTKDEVSEASLTLSSFDYGAWADLRVTAEGPTGKLPVTFQGKTDPVIPIPYNGTDQRASAAWLRRYGMEGSPDDADQARVPGQVEIGDGLSVYEKYRGLVVSEGGARTFKRLDPTKKTHFVIDAKQALDLGRWERTTDTVAYRVDLDMATNRQVNLNGGHAGAGAKYAVRLEVTPGMTDPDTLDVIPGQLGYTRGGKSPGDTDVCRIFPDRVRAKIARIAASIQAGVDDPASDDGALIQKAGASTEGARAQLRALTPARREQLAQNMISLLAIHESLHGASVPGHGPVAAFGKEWEETDDLVDASCPMQYMSNVAWRQYLLFGRLGGEGKICQLCSRSFNVKH